MKIFILLCASLFVLGLPTVHAEETDIDVSVPKAEAAAMKGTFVGDFGGKKITICIDRIIGETVTGYSIVGGNERAFSGSFKASDEGFQIIAREPGNRPDDGLFKMIYSRESNDLAGVWIPNDTKKIAERVFVLPSRAYKYDPNAGEYPQSSSRLLTEKDVENIRPADLRIMRNEIYARHGYSFKLADMRKHFDQLDWYMAISQDISDRLTEKEKKNAALIKRFENYTKEYYDSFGR
ncbi:MAG: YARHG domain-containing protein [Verrucomicrobia bacterium]|jgi:hypothetical protein|nr:YARHG domain-containing protein [Verrucomicrobiota bacterium]|tara:strand:+ start:25085 stop:25795 length:711 start_codon:yes stop_codon:yes gene_type:complete